MAPLRSALARRAIPQVRGNGALCLQHHKEADAGAFTPEQLRTLKEDPFLRRVDVALIGGFIWKREQLILRAGGGFYVRCSVLLEMASRPIIWLSTDADGNSEVQRYNSKGHPHRPVGADERNEYLVPTKFGKGIHPDRQNMHDEKDGAQQC